MWDYVTEHYWRILFIINYVLAISAAVTIILKNIDPTKTLTYIFVLVFFPFFGLVIYYLFGQEYRKSKIFNRKDILNASVIKSSAEKMKLTKRDLDKIGDKVDDKIKLVKLLTASDKSPLTINNDAEIIINGIKKFERLIDDLKAAKNFIHIEYYIIKSDRIGTKFLDVLCEKAAEGLEVRLIYDDVGTKISREYKRKLSDSGVDHHPFMPVLFSGYTGKMNYRNHRKIAIIDGTIGYVGGINISDSYVNYKGTDESLYWRDTHLRICGEAVKVLQFHFLTTWDFVLGEKIEIKESFFPETDCDKNVAIQIAASGPDTDWANIMEAIFTAINNAEEYVYLTTPYFIPNGQIISALQVAAKIGLDVRLLIPKESDSWIAKHASNSFLEPILAAGVRVFLYQKGFIHAKTMVVDDSFCTVGTCNMDNRSFNINFEINALIYDIETAKEMRAIYLNDLQDSEEVDFERWQQRSKFCKMKESYSRLWAPLL